MRNVESGRDEAAQTQQTNGAASSGPRLFATDTLRGQLAVLFAGAASLIAGCDNSSSSTSRTGVAPAPRPSFSTLVENQQRNIAEIPQDVAAREALLKSSRNAQDVLDNVVTRLEATRNSSKDEGVRALLADGNTTSNVRAVLDSFAASLKSAAQGGRFSGQGTRLTDIANEASSLSNALKPANFSAPNTAVAPVLTQAHGLLTKTADLSLALDWDIKQLQPGVAAPRLIGATTQFKATEDQLQAMLNGFKQYGTAWVSSQGFATAQQQVVAARDLSNSLQNVGTMQSIRQDLSLLSSSLNDVLRTTQDQGSINQFWTKAAGQNAAPGELVVKQAIRLLAAMREDFTQELGSSGIRPVAAVNQGSNGSFTNSPLFWYMVMRGSRDYDNTYYRPAGSYSYSPSTRLHTSSGWGHFSQAADENYSTNRNRPLENSAGKEREAQARSEAAARARAAREAAARESASSHSSSSSGSSSYRGGGFGSSGRSSAIS